MFISENLISHYFVKKKNFFKQLGFKKRKLDEISEQDDIIMDESNYQGMYKNRAKNDRKYFEILVILSYKQANRQKSGWEKFKRHKFP